ncbi:MAG: glycosyltransferase family 1 protein, partial [Pedobacter sp.]
MMCKCHEQHFLACRIRSRFPLTVFKLIGPYDSNIDAITPALYQEIASGDTIQYMGQVDDVRPEVESSSVMVLPSYYGEG